MKRSEIDSEVSRAIALAGEYRFALPRFATWSRAEWKARAPSIGRTLERGLGWNVTDFGRGDFSRFGLCLCTLRNGTIEERDSASGQTYAEKIMSVAVGQETPFHFHDRKAEDIINRGGGRLVLELHPNDAGGLGRASVTTFVDGIETTLPAGRRVSLEPGQSIHIPTGVFHRFWAEDDRVFAAEVSCVNDDVGDNTFLEPFPRFASIEEDAPPRFALVSEYATLL